MPLTFLALSDSDLRTSRRFVVRKPIPVLFICSFHPEFLKSQNIIARLCSTVARKDYVGFHLTVGLSGSWDGEPLISQQDSSLHRLASYPRLDVEDSLRPSTLGHVGVNLMASS